MLSLEEKTKLLNVNNNIHALKGFLLKNNLEANKLIEGTILSGSVHNLTYLIREKNFIIDSIDFLHSAFESKSIEMISFVFLNLTVDLDENLLIKTLNSINRNRKLLTKSLNHILGENIISENALENVDILNHIDIKSNKKLQYLISKGLRIQHSLGKFGSVITEYEYRLSFKDIYKFKEYFKNNNLCYESMLRILMKSDINVLNYVIEKKGLIIKDSKDIEFYHPFNKSSEITNWSSSLIATILKILPNLPSEKFLKACINQLTLEGNKYNKDIEIIWNLYKDTHLLNSMLNSLNNNNKEFSLAEYACKNGNVVLFNDLIKYGFKINDKNSYYLLYLATNNYDLKITKALYENNCDMSNPDILNNLVEKLESKKSYNMLKDDVKNNCLSVIKFLVKVNKGNYGILEYREEREKRTKKNIEQKIIKQRLKRAENHNKNILYIATNDNGLIKIGITDVSAEKRVEKFTKDYDNSFKLILKFDLNNNIANTTVETLFHEILNSKFLNVNFLQKNKLSNEFEDFVKIKDNGRCKSGYTEIFILEKDILKNLIVLMHLLNITEIKPDHFNTINLLKENDNFLSEIKNINKIIKKNEVINTFKDKNLLIKPLLNNQTNILKKNFAYIAKKIENDQRNDCFDNEKVNFLLKNNKLFFSYESYSIDASNIIHGCSNDIDRLNLISINQPNFKSFKDLGNVILNIRKENLNLSGQKNYIKII